MPSSQSWLTAKNYKDRGYDATTHDNCPPELPDLPEDLRHALPRRAQEIYRATYNRVYETSMASGEDHDAQSIAETAHKAALLAVEMEYQKDHQSRWRRAPISEDMDKTPTRV